MKYIKKVFFIAAMIFWIFSVPVSSSASVQNSSWDGTTVTQPASMKMIDGIYYYEIFSAEELAYLAKTGGNWLEYNYILANDIILNDASLTYDEDGNLTADVSILNQWTPIETFTGIFDGNNHTISGLYVDTDSTAGLFAQMCGTVKNLTIKNAYVKGKTNVGGICGTSSIAGKEILNCNYHGAVIGTDCVAGITGKTDGYNGSSINNCVNYGDIWSSNGNTGGIVGYAGLYTASVTDCKNNGTIVSEGNNVGGICGSYFWMIEDCTNNGDITGKNNVGGICGDKSVPVRNSINRGMITGKNNVGGIVGYSSSDTDGYELYNIGNVAGETYVGGICGYGKGTHDAAYFTMREAYNTGDVSGGSYVGGLLGYTYNTNVSESYSTGNVTGTSYAGGCIGYSESVWGKGTVSNCYYLKTDSINESLVGLGNPVEDIDGIVMAKELSYFTNIPMLPNPFGDVMNTTYYYRPVLWAVECEITSGLSSNVFGVGETCTREQLVTFLWRMAGQPKANAKSSAFVDVQDGKWYTEAILWATEKGYVSGYDKEYFGIGDACTREQTVTILWRYASSPNPSSTTCTFKDAKHTEYYYKAMLWAVENKVVAGYNDSAFGVGDLCTREQIVTFLYRYDNIEVPSA